MSAPEVRRLVAGDRSWAAGLLEREWHSTRIVSRGRVQAAAALPGFVALLDAERVGLLTWSPRGDDREVVTLNSVVERRGVGRALRHELELELRLDAG